MLESVSVLFRTCKQPLNFHSKACNPSGYSLLAVNKIIPHTVVPSRTTFILKRRFPVGLYSVGNTPRIKRKSFFYDLVEDTEIKREPQIDVILKTYVEGVGNEGDIITMPQTNAYYKLLLPNLADYSTPESLERAKALKKDEALQQKQMSPTVENLMRHLERGSVSVVMNKETEWTIEPWHVRASFRKAGIHILSDESIELPKKPIRGPDMDLENKEFYVTLTINRKHKARVRCFIHHWSTSIHDRLPYGQDFWLNSRGEVFPENKMIETADSGSSTSS